MIRNCLICKKEFNVYPAKIKEGKGKYCSLKCYKSSRPQKENYSCSTCRKTIKRYSNYTKRSKNLFCSRACRKQWMSKNGIGENSPRWSGGDVDRTCEICGQSFSIPASVIEIGKGKYCSQKCYWTSLSDKMTGENNHFWEGGKSFEPYPVTFNGKFKRMIRERDSYTCAFCGKLGKDVHHIDYDKKNTAPENCITLCRSCHTRTNSNRKKWHIILFAILETRLSGLT